MSARDIVGGLAGAAVSAARKPLETTARAVGVAKGVASTGGAAAEGLAHQVATRLRSRHHVPPVKQSQPAPESGPAERTVVTQAPEPAPAAEEAPPDETTPDKTTPARKTASRKATPAKKSAAKKTTAKKAARKIAPAVADDGPQVVLREPAPPAEPPIDVVGEALAAEGEPSHARAGEPRAASRDEEHGDASLQRAEVDEIAEETREGLPGGDVTVETPVGTTGAGEGFNPDTAETDLQQPQTEPLVDPALTKAVRSAQKTGKKASTRKPQG